MSRAHAERWIPLRPPLSGGAASNAVLVELASDAKRAKRRSSPEDYSQAIDDVLQRGQTNIGRTSEEDRTTLTAAAGVLCDLLRQGWNARVRNGGVEVLPPAAEGTDVLVEKDRVRRQELIKRDEQLEQPATRAFVLDMERPRLYQDRLVSIFTLMREGRELAASLRNARSLTGSHRTDALVKATDPYVQFVAGEARCEFTGLRLQDIWRYFRHTWVTQYSSTPGRTMSLIIRDRARAYHPVVGIAAIGSPIVQIRERDAWIGWHPGAFFRRASQNPSPQLGRWIQGIVGTAIAEIFIDDFVEEGLLSLAELREPTAEALARLRSYGGEQRRLHHRFVRAQEHKDNGDERRLADSRAYWTARARTHLFRSKRALALADLLRARTTIERVLGTNPTASEVMALLADPEGKRAVSRILRKAKADRVGIAIADITVCGAVQPYNAILGGKLVAMLAASPDVVLAYRQRYGAAESEIASSMAGRPIVRQSDLVLLGTSSLYGVGSSQYNRVRVPAERLGGRKGDEIRYLELGRSEAFGTSQFSGSTVAALIDLVQRSSGGQRVNSIFGEGVSPKLRKVRHGLELLAFPSERLLRHGRRRIVYGVALARNAREYLLGLEKEPDYLFSLEDGGAAAAIAEWWRERWLSRRMDQDAALLEVEAQTLVRPIRHGARVVLPDSAESETNYD